ncbi:SIMPL domain-containing protein [Nonomuraea sp. NPDC050663]|uniref:SIMPL domain-containing protein n=1 Tax=Nonomuraea sp. NPDC050663 TaxID=3364370 RepID=UPI0037A10EC4
MDHTHEQITVVGEGAITAAPDLMRLMAGVEVRRATPGEAFSASRTAAAKLTKTLVEAGIDAVDLRTNELSLGPEYEAYPKVAGYRAAQGVEAVIRDLSRADEIIDTVAGVGEEVRLNGVAFELSKPDEVLEKARERAFGNAAAKAAQYASLAERRLGRVVSVSEEVNGPPQPLMAAAEAFDAKGSVSPGRQTISVTVRVVYGFAD